MASTKRCAGAFVWTILVVLLSAHLCQGDSEITHDDVDLPSQPGCDNSFVLVSLGSGSRDENLVVGVARRILNGGV